MKDPSVAQSIVFVVDDDAAIRESIESLFESAGLQVALTLLTRRQLPM
jgi:FixJ family two-component response regulator